MKTWLLDTGPIVAFLDATEPEHERVSERLADFAGRLHTTSAVIVEAMHFVGSDPRGPSALVELIEATGMRIVDCCGLGALRSATRLMSKYQKLPMDFADATLVLLADQVQSTEILTLDRRGFGAYRSPQGRSFTSTLDVESK
jgi:predicted nucleic acid-binding protein